MHSTAGLLNFDLTLMSLQTDNRVLRAKLNSTVYCYRSCLFVCLFVGLFVCGSVTTIT